MPSKYDRDLAELKEFNKLVRSHNDLKPVYKNLATNEEFLAADEAWCKLFNKLASIAKKAGFIRIFDGSYKLDLSKYPVQIDGRR